jgi:hypothetical protein
MTARIATARNRSTHCPPRCGSAGTDIRIFRHIRWKPLLVVDLAETGEPLARIHRLIDEVNRCTRGETIRVHQRHSSDNGHDLIARQMNPNDWPQLAERSSTETTTTMLLKALGRTGFESPSPTGCQDFLDAGQAVDQLGDASLGCGPLDLFQGQEQLPAGVKPAVVDLADVIAVW